MPSDFLSRPAAKPIPAHSHRHTIVWQFLQATRPGDGELGQLLRKLRDRRDMPRHFPHRTALVKYMTKCKVDSGTVMRNAQHVYALYVQFHQQVMHPKDDSAVEFVPPSALIKSGVSRDEIGFAILTGFRTSDNPREQWEQGGRLRDSALDAADAVIDLFASKGGMT